DGELAVREVHHPHHAEDHRKPERHQAVDEAGEDALDDDFEIDGGIHTAGDLSAIECLSLRRLVPHRSPPPCGEGTGVGVARLPNLNRTTPTPNPSPQGGGEHTESAARF